MIVKTKQGYEVHSESGKRLGGPYKTEGEAKKRLEQVEWFKAHDRTPLGGAPRGKK